MLAGFKKWLKSRWPSGSTLRPSLSLWQKLPSTETDKTWPRYTWTNCKSNSIRHLQLDLPDLAGLGCQAGDRHLSYWLPLQPADLPALSALACHPRFFHPKRLVLRLEAELLKDHKFLQGLQDLEL